MDVDYWKTWLANRLESPMGQDGAWTVFKESRDLEHMTLAKHLCAEQCETELVRGKMVKRWTRIRKANHYLDCGVMNCVAAHMKGARLKGQEVAAKPKAKRVAPARVVDEGGIFDGGVFGKG
jgi:hypothetical protein